ncbi:MAG: VOC family protein [Gallionellaceae bacterium]|nr:VOC family protein [Gallionellaceae bacterium]
METLGLHHLGLAVSNLRASAAFFTDCLGWSIAKEVPTYPAIYVTNGSAFVTLWQTDSNPQPFDRKRNVGLHHFAIKVSSEAALDEIFKRVSEHPGVVVEFNPELLGSGPAKHCMVFEPSGIRVEFIWVP